MAGLGAAALLACPGVLRAEPIRDTTLANGLRIVVEEDHGAPDVAIQVWYKVGSADEAGGKTGLAHLLEHLMFGGTAAFPQGPFAARIAAAGGRVNAFTGYHYTAYATQVPGRQLDVVLGLEADRMRSLALSDAGFAYAQQAIARERKWRIEDSAPARLRQQLIASALAGTAMAHPLIGWKEDVEKLTVADAAEWHARWYAPNQAVVVIVGDVDANAAIALTERHFGWLPAKTAPARDTGSHVVVGAPGRVRMSGPAAQPPYLAMAYPVPGLGSDAADEEPYALQILAAYLRQPSAGAASERDVAVVHAWYDPYRAGTGLLLIDATGAAPSAPDGVEAEICRRIDAVKRDGVSEARLEEIKADLIRIEVERTRSEFERARRIGLLECMGLSFRLAAQIPDRIGAVGSASVGRVARRYLADSRGSVVELIH